MLKQRTIQLIYIYSVYNVFRHTHSDTNFYRKVCASIPLKHSIYMQIQYYFKSVNGKQIPQTQRNDDEIYDLNDVNDSGFIMFDEAKCSKHSRPLKQSVSQSVSMEAIQLSGKPAI